MSAYDAAVIGLGSAGEAVSRRLTSDGRSVVGFEADLVGGICPFVACIPSKAMLHDAASGRTWDEAVTRRDELTRGGDDASHVEALEEAGVLVVRGEARITGDRMVEADGDRFEARNVILATGAEPVRPDIPGIDDDAVWTSTDAMRATRRPERLAVLGSGPIGCELGEVFARLGSEVGVYEIGGSVSADAEPEVADLLADGLRHHGVDLHLGAEAISVRQGEGGAEVTFADGTVVATDRVLLATGVRPRVHGIGLESVGIDPDIVDIGDDGAIDGRDWLWAIGDVTPTSKWTHGANLQGERLADLLAGRAWPGVEPVMPSCIFTHPPLGRVGLTSAGAAAEGLDAVVGRASYSDTARWATDELGDGLAAVVVDRPTGAVLGASIAGPRADDLIQIVTVVMASGMTVREAARTVFPFPTASQVVGAALHDAVSQLGPG